MAKWADYLVSAVRYNHQETHIDMVRSHEDKGDSVGAAVDTPRSTVVSRLASGSTFATITKSTDGKWQRGEDVRAITIDGEKYIRTDANRVKKDNLGELPRF